MSIKIVRQNSTCIHCANVTLYAIWKKEVKVGDIISLTSTKGTTERFYVLSYDESTQKA